MRLVRLLGLVLAGLAAPGTASASNLVFGYVLGASESLTTSLTNNSLLIGNVNDTLTGEAGRVAQLTGVNFNTTVSANATLDIITRRATHGFLTGLSFNRQVTALQPSNGLRQDPLSGAQVQAQYALNVTRPRYVYTLSAGYTFGSNGILSTAANGGQTGNNTGQTLPGAGLGGFVLRTQSHTVSFRTGAQWVRPLWETSLGASYDFSINGITTLTPARTGVLGQAPAPPSTALGAFLPVNTHSVNAQLSHRRRTGNRSNVSFGVNSGMIVPQGDTSTAAGALINAAALVGTTLNNGAQMGWDYRIAEQRLIGLQLSGNFNLRTPLGLDGLPSGDALAKDAAIYRGRMTYADLLRWGSTRLNLSAGAAQAVLFQRPFGAGAGFYDEPIFSPVAPIFSVDLARRFDPVDLALNLSRDVVTGVLGASAIISESASLTAIYQVPMRARTTLLLNAGLSVGRLNPVDELPPPNVLLPGVAQAVFITNDSTTVGATAGARIPIYRAGLVEVSASGAYSFTYSNAQLGVAVDDEPDFFSTHTLFFSLLGTFGRGAVNDLANNSSLSAEDLNTFSRNPSSAPLVSATLATQSSAAAGGGNFGATQENLLPGAAAEAVIQEGSQQLELDRKAQEDIYLPTLPPEALEEAEEEEQEQEEQREERRGDRKREFGKPGGWFKLLEDAEREDPEAPTKAPKPRR